jgi:hypothetical protein
MTARGNREAQIMKRGERVVGRTHRYRHIFLIALLIAAASAGWRAADRVGDAAQAGAAARTSTRVRFA